MRVVEQPNLGKRTTLGLGGVGLAELVLGKEEEFDRLSEALDRFGGTPVVWGRGSNILARDGVHSLTLISLEAAGTPEIVSEGESGARVRVRGGQRLSGLLAWSAKAGLSGLEPLAGIPGSVGGAVRMNAGSFGREMADLLCRVRIWTRKGGLRWIEREGFSCGYRSFALQGAEDPWVVAEAELELTRVEPERVRAAIAQSYGRKKAAQPVAARTCGCAFKNPAQGKPAGWLLEQAGFRGRRLGGVGFSERHANFLIHHGQGTASQALELIGMAREQVLREFGVELETEVKVYP